MQEQPHKRKWTEKTDAHKIKKRPDIKNKNQKITDVDNAEHQIGQDNISAQQNQQKVENAKEAATTKRCVDR